MELVDREPSSNEKDPAAGSFGEGLATGTYLAIRGKEECYRAHRYRRPLALVIVKLAQPDSSSERRLQTWLRSKVRASDIVAFLEPSTYAVLLPESDEQAAADMIARVLMAFPQLRAFSASYPADGGTWEELFGSIRWKTGGVPGDNKFPSETN